MKGTRKVYKIGNTKYASLPKELWDFIGIEEEYEWEDLTLNGEKVIVIRKINQG